MSILGTRVVRVEDPLFLTTGATYTEDLVDDRLAGALHAVFVRSPIAHGELVGLDATEALEVDGVVAVLTDADLGLPAPRSRFRDGVVEPVLAARPGPLRRPARRRRPRRDPLRRSGCRRTGRRRLHPAACRRRPAGGRHRRSGAFRGGRHEHDHLQRRGVRPGVLRRLRDRGRRARREPARRPGAAGGACRRRRLGRGWQAHVLVPEPGRPGHQGEPGRGHRSRTGRRPGDHARRRWGVRRQVRRRP